MADQPTFESPVVRSYDSVDSGDLLLTDISATTKWLVRASPDGAVAEGLGAPFGSSNAAAGGATALGSRPGEWIVLGTAGAVAEAVEGLEGLDSSDFVSCLDWTHGRALFRVTGNEATRMLEKVCSLDWSEPMTPDGAVASASVAKVTCDIARRDVGGTPSYLVFCDRSLGQYLFDALIDAGDELGLVVAPAGG